MDPMQTNVFFLLLFTPRITGYILFLDDLLSNQLQQWITKIIFGLLLVCQKRNSQICCTVMFWPMSSLNINSDSIHPTGRKQVIMKQYFTSYGFL